MYSSARKRLRLFWSFDAYMYKQRVLMHRHQGWNVRHGLCHIYMRYLYIYELFIAFVCFVVCSLLQRDGICGVLCGKWQARESTGMLGNLMAIYYIMPQFIQNHSRFVMFMKTCMISLKASTFNVLQTLCENVYLCGYPNLLVVTQI